MKKLLGTLLLLLLSVFSANGENGRDKPDYSGNPVVDSVMRILCNADHTPREKMKLYFKISDMYAAYDMPRTRLYAEKGLAIAEKLGDKRETARFLGHLASTYIYTSVYDSAFIFLDRMQELSEEIGDKELLRGNYQGLATIYAREGHYARALENYMKILPLCEDEPEIRIYAITLGNIGEIHRRLNNLGRAEYFLRKAIGVIEITGEAAARSQACRELGHVYLLRGDADKALEYFMKIPAPRAPVHEGDLMAVMGQAYIIKKEYGKALQCAGHCVEAADVLGDPYIYVLAYNLYADVYRQQGRYRECEEMAMKSWQIDSLSVYSAPVSAFNIAYANMFMGNPRKADYFFQKYTELNDELNEKNFRESMIEIDVKYETAKKEMHIAALEREKGYFIWLSFAAMAILCLALGLLYSRHRMIVQKRRLAEQQVCRLEQEKQLVATQALLDGETAERSRLARDLHDRLGGMLSVVKLNLGHLNSTETPDVSCKGNLTRAMDMLDESIDELRRVAHHLMPESLMRYGLKVAIEDFCRAIPGAHFLYIGSGERLDSRLEILLYHCAWELVNNAVKHASAGQINVQLLADNGVVALTVSDNGVGFDPEAPTGGTGLKNIRTRVRAYDGRMSVYASPGAGTEVCIEIELQQ